MTTVLVYLVLAACVAGCLLFFWCLCAIAAESDRRMEMMQATAGGGTRGAPPGPTTATGRRPRLIR